MRANSPGIPICFVLLTFAVLSGAAGCDDPTIVEQSITVSGDVIDADTQEPIDSAWVVMGDTAFVQKNEYTDSLGQFSLPSPPFPSSYKVLYAGKSGYRTGVDTVWNAENDVTDVLIELGRGDQ